MNLGGPVWHASVSTVGLLRVESLLRDEAVRQLQGVGDASLGEWHEWTGVAYHIRRRLSIREQRLVGPVVDIRRTPEAAFRAARLGDRLQWVPPDVLASEVG